MPVNKPMIVNPIRPKSVITSGGTQLTLRDVRNAGQSFISRMAKRRRGAKTVERGKENESRILPAGIRYQEKLGAKVCLKRWWFRLTLYAVATRSCGTAS
jgi:hypothetical protein